MESERSSPTLRLKRLNLGCGHDYREGHVNVDMDPGCNPDYVRDVSWLPDFPAHFYEAIVALDLLEHIPRIKCVNTLREWNRLLVPNGKLELQVPNLLSIIEHFQQGSTLDVNAQLDLLVKLHGNQCNRGDYHFMAFTPQLLAYFLAQAGFSIVYLEEHDDWLFEVKAVKTAESPVEALYGLADDREFVEQAFSSRLLRPASKEDLDFYIGVLSDGNPREAVVAAIEQSSEYRCSQAEQETYDYLYAIESDEAFVSTAYVQILGRTADKKGLRDYLTLASDKLGRRTIVKSLLASSEYRDKSTR